MVNIWLRSLTRTWAHRQTQEDGGRGEQIGIACDGAVFSLCLLNCTKGEHHGVGGGMLRKSHLHLVWSAY